MFFTTLNSLSKQDFPLSVSYSEYKKYELVEIAAVGSHLIKDLDKLMIVLFLKHKVLLSLLDEQPFETPMNILLTFVILAFWFSWHKSYFESYNVIDSLFNLT